MAWTNNEHNEVRERAERVLSGLKQVEAEYERTRDKIVERTEWGVRIRYVERNKKKRDGKRFQEHGTGGAGSAESFPEEFEE